MNTEPANFLQEKLRIFDLIKSKSESAQEELVSYLKKARDLDFTRAGFTAAANALYKNYMIFSIDPEEAEGEFKQHLIELVGNDTRVSLLQVAAEAGNLHCVTILANEVPQYILDSSGNNAPIMIALNKQYEEYNLVGGYPKKGLGTPYYEIIKCLAEHGADVNCNYASTPPLHCSTWNADIDMADLLLKNGATIFPRQILNDTPLHMACNLRQSEENGTELQEKLLKRLLEENLDIDQKDFQGNTALNIAAAEGLTPIISILLKAGAAIDLANNSRITPLMSAASNNHLGAVMALIEAGADLYLENDNRETAYGCVKGNDINGVKSYLGTIQTKCNNFSAIASEISDNYVTYERLYELVSEAILSNPEKREARLEKTYIGAQNSLHEYYLGVLSTLNQTLTMAVVGMSKETTPENVTKSIASFITAVLGFAPVVGSTARGIARGVKTAIDAAVDIRIDRRVNRLRSLIPGSSTENVSKISENIARTLSIGMEDYAPDSLELVRMPLLISQYNKFRDWLEAKQLISEYHKLGVLHASILLSYATTGKLTPTTFKSDETILPLIQEHISVDSVRAKRQHIYEAGTPSSSPTVAVGLAFFSGSQSASGVANTGDPTTEPEANSINATTNNKRRKRGFRCPIL